MSDLTTIAEDTLSVLPPSAIESMQRAEIDVQISTAHRFPRSMQVFKKRAIEMATLDEETAASCLYSRPVGGGKFAEGLSVRTAEIVGACYGNLRVAAIIVEQTERYVKARGMAHDLESNFASACEVIESTVKKDGKPYDERMRVVIAKAALAKARRDATFQVVPKALCKPIEQAARRVAVGDATTIAARRSAVMAWIGKLGIDAGRVFAAIGVNGEEEIGLDALAQLTGIKTAIKDGDVTVDEAFPAVPQVHAVSKPPTPGGGHAVSKSFAKPVEPPPDGAAPTELATPAQGVRNLAASAQVSEAAVLQFLHENGVEGATLEAVSEPELQQLIARFVDCLPAIKACDAGLGNEPPTDSKVDVRAAVRQKLSEAGIEESALVAHLLKTKAVTNQRAKSLDEGHINEGRVEWILSNWDALVTAMKGVAGKASAE